MSMEEAQRERAPQISGVSNVAYDLIALLYNKLEGIAALEEYRQDAQDADDREVLQLIEDLQMREIEDVERLKGLVAQRLR